MRDDNTRPGSISPRTFATPVDVIADLLTQVEPGDTIWVHRPSCDTRLDDGECDCAVIMVPIDGHVH